MILFGAHGARGRESGPQVPVPGGGHGGSWRLLVFASACDWKPSLSIMYVLYFGELIEISLQHVTKVFGPLLYIMAENMHAIFSTTILKPDRYIIFTSY